MNLQVMSLSERIYLTVFLLSFFLAIVFGLLASFTYMAVFAYIATVFLVLIVLQLVAGLIYAIWKA